jgi:outer membrane protein OmpA-like peptidoglycan-associated protein
MKKSFFLLMLMIMFLFLGTSCTRQHFGVPDRALGYPSEFDETEAAIAKSEQSSGAKYCPEKIARAKELGKQGVLTWWGCDQPTAFRLFAEARQLAKEAEGCQPPPPAPALPKPPAPAPGPGPAPAPAPAPTPAPAPAPALKPVVFDTVYFDPNKTNINPTAAKALDKNGQILNGNPNIRVEIGGHSDGQGKIEANQKTSEKRAQSVKKYLMDKFNIPEKQMIIKGYGTTMPVADNKTQEGRSKNRRVEFKPIP